ncbi:DUF3471 domain-containing protein [Spirosoma fluviale]|uniref:DUF3471 domain-containing protein n=1 Tax=Spirosoma fluviale TaxID=1597977 RepID=A0A286F7H0_9BACT|nr:DUF3471 domain-containing protein [Spirosoma fluviale]SOD79177.1 hypothetical protein SAMN06269250_0837 [Spirosoma fluviale]
MKYVLNVMLAVSLLLISVNVNAQTAPKDTTILRAYVGSYTFASGSPIQKFTVTAEKGELYGEADTFGKNKLVKQAKADTYQSTSSYGSIITFAWDTATKAVASLTMAVQGTELTAKKDNP